MIRDITLGQYFAGNSILHKIDPRTKILSTIVYILVLFLFDNFLCYIINFFVIFALYNRCGISFKMMLNNIKPVLPILIFTSIINLFTIKDGNVIFDFWIFSITDRSIVFILMIFLRIILLIFSSSLLTYTTLPIDLTYGLERILKPLSKIKFPVDEISMMISIAIRFVPTLVSETEKIILAQKSRGVDMESGNIVKKVKCMIPILIPLFISAFRRADELAMAMESRCYRVGESRTRYKKLQFCYLDLVFVGGFVAVVAILMLVNMFL